MRWIGAALGLVAVAVAGIVYAARFRRRLKLPKRTWWRRGRKDDAEEAA